MLKFYSYDGQSRYMTAVESPGTLGSTIHVDSSLVYDECVAELSPVLHTVALDQINYLSFLDPNLPHEDPLFLGNDSLSKV